MLHILLAACAVYAALCLALLLINLAALPRLFRQPPAGPDAPLLSIIVPARNEERGIGGAARSLLAQEYPQFEVIVVNDRSTDRTGEILRGLATDPRLTVIDGAEPPAGWLGKPHALFQGARRARGDLLLFVDADVHYHPAAAAQAVGFLLREGADFVALLPKFEMEGFWEAVLMPNLLCAAYFGPAFLANRDRPRWLAAGGGAGNLVRRSAYEAIGGHEALRASVIDDVRLGVAAKQAGFRARVVDAHDRLAVRMYHGFAEVWDGFTKNIAFAMGGWTGLLFLLLSIAWTGAALLPPAALAAALAGAAIPARDALLAAGSIALLVLARAILARAAGNPVWASLTHPLMAAVWAALLVRSFHRRFIRKTVLWRGRAFDARKAGF